jgi:hypothetical protein
VRRGGLLRVLLLHPKRVAESLDRTWARHRGEWKQYWLTNCNEAQIALDGIIEAGTTVPVCDETPHVGAARMRAW